MCDMCDMCDLCDMCDMCEMCDLCELRKPVCSQLCRVYRPLGIQDTARTVTSGQAVLHPIVTVGLCDRAHSVRYRVLWDTESEGMMQWHMRYSVIWDTDSESKVWSKKRWDIFLMSIFLISLNTNTESRADSCKNEQNINIWINPHIIWANKYIHTVSYQAYTQIQTNELVLHIFWYK